jgi:hypothetical protein
MRDNKFKPKGFDRDFVWNITTLIFPAREMKRKYDYL